MHVKDLATKVKAAPDSVDGKAAMKELIDILDKKSSFAKSQACYAFDELGPLATPAVPALMRAAKSGDRFVRKDAIRGLRSIGPAAAVAVDLLIDIVETANSTRAEAAGARARYAIEALGNIGKPACKSIPTLERVLQLGQQLEDNLVVEEAQISLNKLRRLQESEATGTESDK